LTLDFLCIPILVAPNLRFQNYLWILFGYKVKGKIKAIPVTGREGP
jgi:hypothetical protein